MATSQAFTNKSTRQEIYTCPSISLRQSGSRFKTCTKMFFGSMTWPCTSGAVPKSFRTNRRILQCGLVLRRQLQVQTGRRDRFQRYSGLTATISLRLLRPRSVSFSEYLKECRRRFEGHEKGNHTNHCLVSKVIYFAWISVTHFQTSSRAGIDIIGNNIHRHYRQ